MSTRSTLSDLYDYRCWLGIFSEYLTRMTNAKNWGNKVSSLSPLTAHLTLQRYQMMHQILKYLQKIRLKLSVLILRWKRVIILKRLAHLILRLLIKFKIRYWLTEIIKKIKTKLKMTFYLKKRNYRKLNLLRKEVKLKFKPILTCKVKERRTLVV